MTRQVDTSKNSESSDVTVEPITIEPVTVEPEATQPQLVVKKRTRTREIQPPVRYRDQLGETDI